MQVAPSDGPAVSWTSRCVWLILSKAQRYDEMVVGLTQFYCSFLPLFSICLSTYTYFPLSNFNILLYLSFELTTGLESRRIAHQFDSTRDVILKTNQT